MGDLWQSARTIAVLGTDITPRICTPAGGGPFPAAIRFIARGSRPAASAEEVSAAADAVVIEIPHSVGGAQARTAVEDCYRALVWAAENASELRLDPERIVLWAEDGAARVAVAVALMAQARRGPGVVSLLLEHPAASQPDGVRAKLEDLPPTYVLTSDPAALPDAGRFVQRLRQAGASVSVLPDGADGTVARLRAVLAERAVHDLHAEHRRDGLGLGVAAPRLSWTVSSSRPGWRQAAYELECRGQTVRVESEESVLVAWPFAPLRSRERIDVRVRVRGRDRAWSEWSERCEIAAGLLEASDWSARFIAVPWEEDEDSDQPAHFFRHEFSIDRPIARARLYASALGVYEPYLNGRPVSGDVLAPGWTSYRHRLRYQAYDVTALLNQGRNAIGAIVADGWYRGRLGFRDQRNLYGRERALLAQLEIAYEDGTSEVVASGAGWQVRTGPVLASSLYDGERYDARLELEGWSVAGRDAGGWAGAIALERDASTLVAATGPPVRRIQVLEPREIRRSPSGRTIVDFGQNLVGRLRIRVRGPAGQTITMRHAEVLEDGELCLWPLRDAAATDTYTLAGRDVETWEPRFTFHGFRYAEIAGWPGELTPDAIQAVVIHSDLERTGWFECSDPLLEQLHENVVWSMRGNFLDVPTDCPQRDERLAWTGDLQLFAPTACFLYDCGGFLASWLADLAAEQAELGGRVPNVVPDVLPAVTPAEPHEWDAPAAGWGDAAAIVPWVLYQRSGDRQVLADQFASMSSWVDYVASLAGRTRLWDSGFQFGDWLDPTAPPEAPDRASTDPSLVATAYFARTAEIVADAAAVLERADARERYRRLAAEVREAFAGRYVETGGRLLSDSQTAYAMALEFCLLSDPDQRRAAGRRLAGLVAENGYRIATGFLGTPLVCDALCSAGEYETAYRLLLQRACPSWLYPVTMGATTIWERWDGLEGDGSVKASQMTSFNHYAFGAIADWLHRTVVGLAPAAPGYRRIAICPVPGGGLTFARARHLTPYGMASVQWRLVEGELEVSATVPPGATAEVSLPGADPPAFEIGSGRHRWTVPAPAHR